MRILWPLASLSSNTPSLLPARMGRLQLLAEGRALSALGSGLLPAAILLRTAREDVYSLLWALVFAFATLNILSLGARHFDPARRGLSFGEVLAILVVIVSVLLLGWEMLYLFHILPIRLQPR